VARALSIDDLRRYAIARSLFPPTTLRRAIDRLGFVQADPIRAPARAQDLTLRHRVRDYRAGELEVRYPRLAVEEDFFVNYGIMPRAVQALMHPRAALRPWDATTAQRAENVLAFVRERRRAHPREIEAHFAHGKVRNYWGGVSNATTHLLDGMHYRGLLRVVRREGGMRIYAPHEHPPASDDPAVHRARLDALVDVAVGKYAPLPARSMMPLLRRLRYATPQWTHEIDAALARAKERLAHARVEGIDWYWPAGEQPRSTRHVIDDEVRLLTPFDPIVWDRVRFEIFWGWTYRFEAYTPAPRRKLGYYALPLLWRDHVIGWANASMAADRLHVATHYVPGAPPRDRTHARALGAEIARMRLFLGVG